MSIKPERRDRRCGHDGLCATPANFNPNVVTAARRDNGEAIVARLRKPMLHGAKFFELRQRLGGQQLRQHSGHRIEIQSVRGNVDRLRADDHVGTLADVHHQRVAIGANNRGKE